MGGNRLKRPRSNESVLTLAATTRRDHVGLQRMNPMRLLARFVRSAALLTSIALAACAQNGARELPAEELARLDTEATTCAKLLARADAAIARARASDAMTTRIAGFPYLRVNRFLASYRAQPMDQARYAEWVSRMSALADEGYAVEVANLPPDARAQLVESTRPRSVEQALSSCVERLREGDAALPARALALHAAARVPDDYADWKRIVGVYYLTRIPFAAGVRRNQEQLQALFEQPLDRSPSQRIRYQATASALDPDQVAALMSAQRRSALGIAELNDAELAALFATYAPVFEIDTSSSADQLGALTWAGALAAVDTAEPVVYTHASHVRMQGRALLQLNYVAWFPARPKTGVFDLLGGHLDGLTWRVTLDEQGAPLLFDSMHNCGCYHLYVPTGRVSVRPLAASWEESAWVPQALDRVSALDRLTLRAEATSHYLYRVLVNDRSAVPLRNYELRPYRELRTLARADGTRRNVFDEQGIIRGSERLERFFFWPMGIAEPGAMRILGRHATAFVGLRHFDDSDLLEHSFLLSQP